MDWAGSSHIPATISGYAHILIYLSRDRKNVGTRTSKIFVGLLNNMYIEAISEFPDMLLQPSDVFTAGFIFLLQNCEDRKCKMPN